ncbi:MAG: hypothetical protein E2O39_00650 [Planctomycetota bacterium]|nr:MAG: hypothetical protein E2O39_00650 [Planctomycetota bacterium]
MLFALPFLATALALASSPGAAGGVDETWPAWRGPDGTGVARSSAPLSWSDDENIKWKVPIPGRGYSTPIAWNGRLFLTTAVPLEELPEPEGGGGGRGRGRGRPSPPQPETAFIVLCLDAETGAVLWERTAKEAKPHEGYHRQYGSHASYSPVTDGERLYASFGSQGVYCYDLDGALLWERDLGAKLEMRRAFGEGAPPVLHGDTLVLLQDHEGDSFIVALNAETGEVEWRVERDEPSSWATPLILEHDGVWQVVTAATNRVRSYALADGELLWECGGLGANAIPSVLRHGDLILAMTGYRNSKLLAIGLGGEGDLTDSDAVKWTAERGLAYTASPVLANGKLFVLMDSGSVSCFDAATGEPYYVQERIDRGLKFKASPIAAGGKLYCASESGDVYVLGMGTELEVLGKNTLDDEFFVASPIAVGGELYLRGREHLYCISEQTAEK